MVVEPVDPSEAIVGNDDKDKQELTTTDGCRCVGYEVQQSIRLANMETLCAAKDKSYLYAKANIDILCVLAYLDGMSDLARTPRQIGTIIQRVRKKRDWTQMQLAERAGLRQATISMIESGKKPAKLESILAVLAALDLEFRIGERSKGHGRDIEELF